MLNTLRQIDPVLLTFAMILLQIGVVVIVGWLVQLYLCKSARQQHFVWLSVLVAAACSAPLHFLVPAWSIQGVVETNSSQSLRTGLVTIDAAKSIRTDPVVHFANDDPNSHQRHAPTGASNLEQPSNGRPPGETGSSSLQKSRTSLASSPPKVDWGKYALLVYVLIALILALRFIAGWVRLRWLSGNALQYEPTVKLAGEIARSLKLKRQPHIILSEAISTPMAFGIFRPSVALPGDFESWELETQRVVLAHEFCHVKRRDAVWDFAARVLSAVYWFHPAVHFAGRRLRQSRETATDAAVLELGVLPTLYARELLRVVTGQNPPRHLPALAMADGAVIEKRIRKILQGPENVNHFSNSAVFKILLVTSLVVLAGFSVQLTEAGTLIAKQTDPQRPLADLQDSEKQENSESSNSGQSAKEPADEQRERVIGDTFYKRISQLQANQSMSFRNAGVRLNIGGTVMDSNGKPAEGAVVILRDGRVLSTFGNARINGILDKTTTDQNGRYEFRNIKSHQRAHYTKVMCVTASGEFAHKTLQRFEPNSTVKMDLQLEKMVPVRGTIIDEEGKPVSEVQLEVAGFTKEISNRGTERIGMRDREMSPTVTTDGKGQFVFPKLPVGYVVRIDAGHPKYAYHSLSIRTTEGHPPFIYGNTRTEKLPINDSGDVITMERGVEIGSKLVDGSGNPLADIEIQFILGVVKTSKDGSFQTLIRQEYLDKRKEIHLRIRGDVFGSLTKRISMETLLSKTSTIKLEKPAVLSGAVVDSNGQPVEGCMISIDSANMSYSRPSDKDGKFVVPKMPPGDVTVSLSDQLPVRHLHLDDVDVRRFTLKPDENKTLEPFVVKRVTALFFIDENEKEEVQILIPLKR